MKNLGFILILCSAFLHSCENRTLSYSQAVNCDQDYDEIQYRLEYFDNGEDADIRYENGELFFDDIEDADYNIYVDAYVEGLDYWALKMRRKMYLPNTWDASPGQLPLRPRVSFWTYHENEPIIQIELQPGWEFGCLAPGGYRIYSSESYPFPFDSTTRVNDAWTDMIGGMINIPIPDSARIYMVEGVTWAANLEVQVRSDTFTLRPEGIPSNVHEMALGDVHEFELKSGISTEVYVEVEGDSLYRLDMYDSDNSTFTAEHIVVTSDYWEGGRRCHAPNGRPVIFRAPENGIVRLEVHKAFEGEEGSFGLELRKFNVFEFSDQANLDIEGHGEIGVLRAWLTSGDKLISTRARDKNKPPIFLDVLSMWPAQDYLSGYEIAAGTSWEASKIWINVPSNRYMYFLYTSTYYHEPNRVYLNL